MVVVGIVGGSGFIGGSLANYLGRNFEVRVLDVVPPQFQFGDNVSFHRCDIRRYNEVKGVLEGVDLIIHTAIIQIPKINEAKRLGYEVNVVGTQNVCRAVDSLSNVKGLILTGSWHTIGERELSGVIDETFGFRPDKVEDRARLYALSKIAQESIVRFYDEMSDKVYGIIRMGTVLGEGMPEKTAANIFIERALKGKSITPYKHSMYRPMLYVDINDICKAFEIYAKKILNDEVKRGVNSLSHIVNVYYPEPITILELAEIVRDAIIEYTNGKIQPPIEIVDKGIPPLFSAEDKKKIKVDIHRAREFLGLTKLISPRESIKRIVRYRAEKLKSSNS